MKKYLNLSLRTILICIACLMAATVSNAQVIKNNQVVMGVVDSVHSKILNETRKIWVYVPAGASDSAYAKQRYPVVYLLDGDGHFASVTGMIQQLSEINGNQVCPDMIVVGIPNTDRFRDLTPTNAQPAKTSGGGEKFTDFIRTELMPHIDSIYPTAPYKMFIGHSLGGLMVINTLINHPDMFNAYVAIDPSMWWDHQKLLNQAREVLKQKKYTSKWLYMGIANTMAPGMDTLQVRKDTTGQTIHIRSILMLKDMIKSDQAANGLKFDYKYHSDDTHGSVPLITEYDALHFLFSFYTIPNDIMVKVYQNKLDTALLKQIDAHYDDVSRQMGYKQYPPEMTVNQLAYNFMARKPDLAFLLFSMNIRNYPGSFNVYDSMGDYYLSVKNNPKAIEYFKKALTIKQFKDTKDKLDKLLAGK